MNQYHIAWRTTFTNSKSLKLHQFSQNVQAFYNATTLTILQLTCALSILKITVHNESNHPNIAMYNILFTTFVLSS